MSDSEILIDLNAMKENVINQIEEQKAYYKTMREEIIDKFHNEFPIADTFIGDLGDPSELEENFTQYKTVTAQAK